MPIMSKREFMTAADTIGRMIETGERLGWSIKRMGRGWNVRDRTTNRPSTKMKHHPGLIEIVNYMKFMRNPDGTLMTNPDGSLVTVPADKEKQITLDDMTFSMVQFDGEEYSLIAIKGSKPAFVPVTDTGLFKPCCSKPECMAKEAARAADMD